MDPLFVVEVLIGIILLGVIIKLLPFILKVLFWVLIVAFILVIIFKVGWSDVVAWTQGITLWGF